MSKSKPPDENETTQNQGGGAGGAAPAGASQAGGGTPPPAQQQAAPAVSQQPAGGQAPSEPRLVGPDDEVKPGETVRMAHDAIKARNSRATKAFLKEQFGIDDPTAIKNKMAQADELAKAADDKRRAEMAEIDRLKEDNSRLNARATLAEQQVAELQELQELAGDEQEIRAVADEIVDPEYWEVVKPKLADHVAATYTADELERMPEDKRAQIVRDFCTDYVKKKPALARASAAAAGGGGGGGGGGTQQQEQQQQQPERRPLRNGVANQRGQGDPKPPPVIQSGKFAGKTLKPGQPNSMTKAEFEEWKNSTGNKY